MKIIVFLVLLSMNAMASSLETQNVPGENVDIDNSLDSINTEYLAKALNTDASLLLIDVRSVNEVVGMGGSIDAQQNVNIPMDWLTIMEISSDKDVPIVVYCERGLRSPKAATILKKLGYSNVKSYSEGFIGWKKAGMPVK